MGSMIGRFIPFDSQVVSPRPTYIIPSVVMKEGMRSFRVQDAVQQPRQSGCRDGDENGQETVIVAVEIIRGQQADNDGRQGHTSFDGQVDAAHQDDKCFSDRQEKQDRALPGQVGQIGY